MTSFSGVNLLRSLVMLGLFAGLAACGQQQDAAPVVSDTVQPDAVTLSDAEVENIVRRTYQFVAMYNVNNKGAFDPNNPMNTGGLNIMKANTSLADHTMQAIARPNNDTLYTFGLLDLRNEPVIVDIPAFDSSYVSLMVTGYDHYVNIPMLQNLPRLRMFWLQFRFRAWG